mmetsp:Transcript_25967/g.56900  ORF Transcript_25967/g.56900 Transcript_25967/m.56900 type:complete len:81 (-) Transcript_25967:40-282(-)
MIRIRKIWRAKWIQMASFLSKTTCFYNHPRDRGNPGSSESGNLRSLATSPLQRLGFLAKLTGPLLAASAGRKKFGNFLAS